MIPTQESHDNSMSTGAASAGFFRCPVPSDQANAVIRIGRKRLKSSVQETSIDGFTVMVTAKEAPKLQIGPTWILEHDGTRHEIHPQWFFNSPEGNVQLGLRRLRDLTQPGPVKRTGKLKPARLAGDQSNGAVLLGGAVLIGIAFMSMPGFGKDLFQWVGGILP